MKRRVLFVDDEPNVLDGIRRMLRPMAAEWDMVFASSGEKALEAIAAAPTDCVVTDMRMPGRDGASLLHEVMALHPKTARIVLSGQSDLEAVYKAVGPMHQYLCKPCDPEVLKTTILRAFALREALTSEHLRDVVGSMRTIPSPPRTYTRIIRELQSPDVSIAVLGEIIREDAGMTAKILQIINSAFFGLARRITDPAQAVTMLGIETVKTLVLSLGVVEQFASESAVLAANAVLADGLEVARIAREIARAEKAPKLVIDSAFTGGILHDVGLLVLVANCEPRMRDAVELARREGLGIWEAEQRVIGASHPEIGGYLLSLWGLPDTVVEAVAFHHAPRRCPHGGFAPVIAVHAAATLAGSGAMDHLGVPRAALDAVYLESIGLGPRISTWRSLAASEPAGTPRA